HAVGSERQPHHRVGVGVRLLDLGRIGFLGQVVYHARDAVAHVIGGGVDIAVEVELDHHARFAVLAGRGHLDDALDARHRALDDLGHLVLDDLRGSAAVGNLHRNDRRGDVRVLAHRHLLERPQAEQRPQQADDDREDRALDGDAGNDHELALCTLDSTRRIAMPCRSDCVPSTTISSPGSSPPVISTEPGMRTPSTTSRWMAVSSCTTNTNLLEPSETMASSGTASASRGFFSSTAVMNMPGRSRPSELSMRQRTVTVRVTGSTRVSMLSTTPTKISSGQATLRALMRWPRASVAR